MDGILLLQPVRRGGFGQRQDAVDQSSEFTLGQPTVDRGGTRLLVFRTKREHGEPMQGAALDVKRTQGKGRAQLSTRNEDHASALCQRANRAIKIRFPGRFPPDRDAVGGQIAEFGIDILRFVVNGEVRTKLPA